jgi:hypothetical protein
MGFHGTGIALLFAILNENGAETRELHLKSCIEYRLSEQARFPVQ